jgi:hypothetical protein
LAIEIWISYYNFRLAHEKDKRKEARICTRIKSGEEKEMESIGHQA